MEIWLAKETVINFFNILFTHLIIIIIFNLCCTQAALLHHMTMIRHFPEAVFVSASHSKIIFISCLAFLLALRYTACLGFF
jgi:fumarate reductase subunit C